MRIRTWAYLVREAGSAVRAGKLATLASVSTVAVSLLTLGLFLALIFNLGQLLGQVEAEVQIRAFLADGIARQPGNAVASMEQKIRGLEGVTLVRFVSREEALKRMRESFGERAGVLEAVEEINPLPDSFEVQVASPERVGPVADAIAGLPGVAKVDYKRETVDKLFRLTAVLRGLGLGIAAFLVLGCVVVIGNAIRLTVFARRREVAIMKLVGATDWFIRWPFLLEGVMMGLGGAVLALGALAGAYWWLAGAAARTLPFLPLLALPDVLRTVTPGLLCLGILVGVVGSGVSLRRFLQV